MRWRPANKEEWFGMALRGVAVGFVATQVALLVAPRLALRFASYAAPAGASAHTLDRYEWFFRGHLEATIGVVLLILGAALLILSTRCLSINRRLASVGFGLLVVSLLLFPFLALTHAREARRQTPSGNEARGQAVALVRRGPTVVE